MDNHAGGKSSWGQALVRDKGGFVVCGWLDGQKVAMVRDSPDGRGELTIVSRGPTVGVGSAKVVATV